MATGYQPTAPNGSEASLGYNRIRRGLLGGFALGIAAIGLINTVDRVSLLFDPTLPKLKDIKVLRVDISKLTNIKKDDYAVSDNELKELRSFFTKGGFRISEGNIVEIDPSLDKSHKLDLFFRSSDAPSIRGNVITLFVTIGNERRKIENTAFNIVYKEEK